MENRKIKWLIIVLAFVFIYSSCADSNKEKVDYYKTGSIKSIKRYNQRNKLDGQSQWFFENGITEQIVLFKDDKENGNAFYFYASGALKSFRFWDNGKMILYGTDFFDDSLNIIKSSILFENGMMVYKKNFNSHGEFINQEGPFR